MCILHNSDFGLIGTVICPPKPRHAGPKRPWELRQGVIEAVVDYLVDQAACQVNQAADEQMNKCDFGEETR